MTPSGAAGARRGVGAGRRCEVCGEPATVVLGFAGSRPRCLRHVPPALLTDGDRIVLRAMLERDIWEPVLAYVLGSDEIWPQLVGDLGAQIRDAVHAYVEFGPTPAPPEGEP